jgi:hypothetical protein
LNSARKKLIFDFMESCYVEPFYAIILGMLISQGMLFPSGMLLPPASLLSQGMLFPSGHAAAP